jgi:hypothetical protein
MVATTFNDILVKGVRSGQIPARTQAARTWFRDTAKTTSIEPFTLMKEDKTMLTNRAAIGSMYLFQYDPKHKKTLPFYDTFPLIFKVDNTPNGFLGINLHYLPYKFRAILMDNLYELTTNSKYDATTKLKISYDILKSASRYKYFRPTVKQYLNKHVRSRFLRIQSTDWDTALFLPLERFEKASKSQVWKDSKGKF